MKVSVQHTATTEIRIAKGIMNEKKILWDGTNWKCDIEQKWMSDSLNIRNVTDKCIFICSMFGCRSIVKWDADIKSLSFYQVIFWIYLAVYWWMLIHSTHSVALCAYKIKADTKEKDEDEIDKNERIVCDNK